MGLWGPRVKLLFGRRHDRVSGQSTYISTNERGKDNEKREREREGSNSLVPHLTKEAGLGLLVVQARAARGDLRVAAALLVHEGVEAGAGHLRVSRVHARRG